jgi:hypothetical protein
VSSPPHFVATVRSQDHESSNKFEGIPFDRGGAFVKSHSLHAPKVTVGHSG